MKPILKFLVAVVVCAVIAWVYQARTTHASMPIDYRIVLERSLDDKSVESFIVNHNCASAGDFQICPAAGVALRMNRSRVIEQVYLYINGAKPFESFSGTLPYGITSHDTMADVQKKLGHPKIPEMPMLGWEPGLPDMGDAPDHLHYWAIYKSYHLIIVYNTPMATDLKAGIYMIVLEVNPTTPSLGHAVIL